MFFVRELNSLLVWVGDDYQQIGGVDLTMEFTPEGCFFNSKEIEPKLFREFGQY